MIMASQTRQKMLFFFLPKNDRHVSGSTQTIKTISQEKKIKVHLKKISDIMNIYEHKKIDLLKIDIEGAEYSVLKNILQENLVINQMVVEFHPHFIKNGKRKTKLILKDLKSHGFKCFGVSKSFLEFSFIKTKVL